MSDSAAGTGGGVEEGETPVGECVRNGEGVWPRWWEKFFNDFKRSANAKSNDGLQAPDFPDIDWAEVPAAGTEIILEANRRRLEQAEARTEKAEERADRLVQRGLPLIALNFLIVGYIASRFQAREVALAWWAVGLAFPVLALVFLGLCVIQAVGVDRVGFVSPAEPASAARLEGDDQIRNLAVQEARAVQMANWTAKKKINEVLYARAWFSRGFAALLVSATVMVVVWAIGEPPNPASPVSCHQCTTTTHSGTATSTTTASLGTSTRGTTASPAPTSTAVPSTTKAIGATTTAP